MKDMENISLAIEFSAAISTDIVGDLSGVAGLLQVCYEQRHLPPGIKEILEKQQTCIMSKLNALSELLGAAVHNLWGESC